MFSPKENVKVSIFVLDNIAFHFNMSVKHDFNNFLRKKVLTFYFWCSVWVARKPPGFAFIDFDDRRDAQDAIRDLDGLYHFYLSNCH